MIRPVGAWLIGGRGSIATCVVFGSALLRRKLIEPAGMVSARGPCASLDLVGVESLVFGGHEVRAGSLLETAGELVRTRVLTLAHLEAGREFAERAEERIRPGVLDGADGDPPHVDPRALARRGGHPLELVAALQADLRRFREAEHLADVVVVNLASTEAFRPLPDRWQHLEGFLADLKRGEDPPASLLYAYAALDAGFPYVNFTPSPGSSVGALQELALEHAVPHCGRDGKTGETLVKTALAPMFLSRNLRVLSWEGYNMLGNRDGETLSDPSHRASKIRSKDEALRQILEDPHLHTKVSIDFVPSLSDWKTAWDFVHFRGFLDVPMSLQFTWQGSDSALAAPLVLDLIRLAEFAHRRRESGVMAHVASFFKSPLGCAEHDFHKQVRLLEEYARSRQS